MQWDKTEFYASYGIKSQLPEESLPEIAFSGRSNVGKSTLINKLCNRKNLARVSSVPGKTATINFYNADDKLFIVDLPGYGYAKVAKSDKYRWSELIEGYINNDRDAVALVVQLIDMRHSPSKDDVQMIDFMIDNELPFIIVLTKADKLSKSQREKRMEGFREEIPCLDDIHVIPFSSLTREGVDELREILLEVSEPQDEEPCE